jgi:hypothetical protein
VQGKLGGEACSAAGRALEAEGAIERLDAVRQPAEAGALCGIRAADTVVDDFDQRRMVVRSHAHDRT